MKTFKEYLSESKKLKTQKGSAIQRSKYGVGKLIGGVLYLHKNYVDVIPSETYDKALNILKEQYPLFKFNVIKWGIKDGSISFVNSKDFDTSPEPIAGDYITVKSDGKVRKGTTNQIWHHKWLWVKDDYKGFDVEESFNRSAIWLQIPDIQFSKIGKKEFWDTEYAPLINKAMKTETEHGSDNEYRTTFNRAGS